jgi:hypothetical protein
VNKLGKARLVFVAQKKTTGRMQKRYNLQEIVYFPPLAA